jgi:hypothetical protein
MSEFQYFPSSTGAISNIINFDDRIFINKVPIGRESTSPRKGILPVCV